MNHRMRAQTLVWVAVMLPLVFLPMVGLTIDAGVMFEARRDLQNVADGAARVGAQELDENWLRNESNTQGAIRIDERRATQAIRGYFARLDVPSTAARVNFGANSRSVEVVVERQVSPRFLRIVHVENILVSAVGRARPCSGVVDDAGCL